MGSSSAARTDPSARRVAVWLSVGLVAWSAVANLVIGDALYTSRNLAWCVVLVVAAVRAGYGREELGLAMGRLRAGATVGVAAAVLVGVVVLLAIGLQDRVPGVAALLADERAQLSRTGLWFAVLVRIPLGTALFEEVAFRGVLFAVWWRAVGPVRATLWSSVAFGLWHVAPTIVALQLNAVAPGSAAGLLSIVGSVLVTTVAGVAFVWLRGRSGSLLAPIIAHWAINAFGLLAAAGR